MKSKTADLIGPALDWAVARALGYETEIGWYCQYIGTPKKKILGYLVYLVPAERNEFGAISYCPSTEWKHGGPIIEENKIGIGCLGSGNIYANPWLAARPEYTQDFAGPTPLIAAMRCFVASCMGYEVDVPEELMK